MLISYVKAFTLVEMLVALAVSSIIIIATYASYDLIATQYRKNLDIADMHTSGRAIMRIIERDIRMAGFEYRDKDAKVTYGSISSPLTIKDSGNKCCDEVTVIYDYFDEESKKAERIRIRYWTEAYSNNKGSRHRLYKQKDILGQNKKILAQPKLGTKDVMADYIEDLQFSDASLDKSDKTKSTGYVKIDNNGKELAESAKKWSCVKDKKTGLLWEVKTTDGGIHDKRKGYRWGGVTAKRYSLKSGKYCVYYDYWKHKKQKCGSAGGVYYLDWDILVVTSNSNNLCGRNDWRVPNQIELLSLIDRSKQDPATDDRYFPNIRGAGTFSYWTNLPWPNDSWNTVNVNFHDGDSNKVRRSYANSHVRLVTNDSTGTNSITSLVNINFVLRTKNQYGKDRQFKKKDYHGGNFKIDKTDKYKRDTFSSTVLVRNLAL